MENSLLMKHSSNVPPDNNYNIGNKLSDFQILQVIAEGENIQITKVKSKFDLKIYILKKYIISKIEKDYMKYVLNEIIIMKYLNHENVVKFYNDFKDQNGNIYIIMEYIEGRDLYTFINNNMNMNIKIEEEKLWNICKQCLDGLVYLHKKGIIHRNINPSNLLMNDKGEIKYCDFKYSSFINIDNEWKFTKEKKKKKI